MFALFSNFLELLIFSDGTSSLFSLYNDLWRKSAFCFLNIFSVRGRVWGRTKPYVLRLDPICFYVFHVKHRWFGNSETNTSLASPCM